MGILRPQITDRKVVVRKTVVFNAPGAATVAAEPFAYVMPEDGHYVSTVVHAGTAPVTGSLIADVNLDGTTLYTTQGSRPTIASTESVSSEAAGTDVTTLPQGSVITFDVDAIGSGTAGSDLTYILTYNAYAHPR